MCGEEKWQEGRKIELVSRDRSGEKQEDLGHIRKKKERPLPQVVIHQEPVRTLSSAEKMRPRVVVYTHDRPGLRPWFYH